MSPDLLREVRNALLRYVGALATDDSADATAELESVAAIIRRLPPNPGGAMPEPDAGMRVTDDGDCKWTVGRCEPAGPGEEGWIVSSDDRQSRANWTPDHIREVRAHDGRVLWRSA